MKTGKRKRAYDKEYYRKNKERARELYKKYYENNKEKIINKKKEHYQKNRGSILQQKKEYYQRNKKRISIRNAENYKLKTKKTILIATYTKRKAKDIILTIREKFKKNCRISETGSLKIIHKEQPEHGRYINETTVEYGDEIYYFGGKIAIKRKYFNIYA